MISSISSSHTASDFVGERILVGLVAEGVDDLVVGPIGHFAQILADETRGRCCQHVDDIGERVCGPVEGVELDLTGGATDDESLS